MNAPADNFDAKSLAAVGMPPTWFFSQYSWNIMFSVNAKRFWKARSVVYVTFASKNGSA